MKQNYYSLTAIFVAYKHLIKCTCSDKVAHPKIFCRVFIISQYFVSTRKKMFSIDFSSFPEKNIINKFSIYLVKWLALNSHQRARVFFFCMPLPAPLFSFYKNKRPAQIELETFAAPHCEHQSERRARRVTGRCGIPSETSKRWRGLITPNPNVDKVRSSVCRGTTYKIEEQRLRAGFFRA